MSIRSKLIALIVVMIMAMITLAGFTTVMANRFAHIADNLYDNAFVGVHYANKVEVGFVRMEQAHRIAGPRSSDKAEIETVLDNLDVAIERAPSAREKQLAVAVRAQIVALGQAPTWDP